MPLTLQYYINNRTEEKANKVKKYFSTKESIKLLPITEAASLTSVKGDILFVFDVTDEISLSCTYIVNYFVKTNNNVNQSYLKMPRNLKIDSDELEILYHIVACGRATCDMDSNVSFHKDTNTRYNLNISLCVVQINNCHLDMSAISKQFDYYSVFFKSLDLTVSRTNDLDKAYVYVNEDGSVILDNIIIKWKNEDIIIDKIDNNNEHIRRYLTTKIFLTALANAYDELLG